MTTEFIPRAGGSLVSNRLMRGESRLGWAFREPSVTPQDNGWRFLSQADDDEYINTPGNIEVADFNRVAEIEPAVLAIYYFPVGSDFLFIDAPDGSWRFVDSTTREEIALPL